MAFIQQGTVSVTANKVITHGCPFICLIFTFRFRLISQLASSHFCVIYIYHLPEVVGGDSSFVLHAEDSKLYRIINAPGDISSFQVDLDKISDWWREHKISPH